MSYQQCKFDLLKHTNLHSNGPVYVSGIEQLNLFSIGTAQLLILTVEIVFMF